MTTVASRPRARRPQGGRSRTADPRGAGTGGTGARAAGTRSGGASRRRTPVRRGRSAGRGNLGLLGTAVVVVALAGALALAATGALVLAGLVAVGVLVALALNPTWVLLLYVACAPWDFMLGEVNANIIKAVGGLLFAAYALQMLRRPHAAPRGPSRADRPTRPSEAYARNRYRLGRLAGRSLPGAGDVRLARTTIVVFLLLVLLSLVLHPNGTLLYGQIGIVTLTRYVSFGLVFLVGVDLLRVEAARWQVVGTFVASSAAAGGYALIQLLEGHESSDVTVGLRVNGPIEDPNDFALFLAVGAVLSAALVLRSLRRRRRGAAAGWIVAGLILLAATAGTFSRGAFIAFFVTAVWAVLARVVRLRVVVGAFVAAGALVGLVVLANPALVSTALQQKSYIAKSNVDTRSQRWAACLRMMAAEPLLGVGPGGFRVDYLAYQPGYDPQYEVAFGTVAHNMYLEAGAELGIPALTVFGGWLVLCTRSASVARRRKPEDEEDRDAVLLATCVQASLIVAMTGSIFLTEQYFLPIWMLGALAVAVGERATRFAPGGGQATALRQTLTAALAPARPHLPHALAGRAHG